MRTVFKLKLLALLWLSIAFSSTAMAFNYYKEGSAVFLKTWTNSQGQTRYSGCGPTQCLSISESSRSRALDMIGGNDSSDDGGIWESRGTWGNCEIWVRPKPQGGYPSLDRVLKRLEKDC